MIVVQITMNVLPDKQKELVQTLLSMIEPTGKEAGCLRYSVFSNIEDKNCFVLLEEWETREHLENHIRSHRFGVLLGSKTLLCEPAKIQINTVSHIEDADTVDAVRKRVFQKELYDTC